VTIGILLCGLFIYINLKKKYDRFLKHIQNTAYNTSDNLLLTYQYNIENLNTFCKSDTIRAELKNRIYRSMDKELGNLGEGDKLFHLLARLHYNDKNIEKLKQIGDEYDHQFMGLSIFYNDHYSSSSNDYHYIKTEEIDSIISYYKKMIACIEQLQKLKIGP
jgi:hypothetical protein